MYARNPAPGRRRLPPRAARRNNQVIDLAESDGDGNGENDSDDQSDVEEAPIRLRRGSARGAKRADVVDIARDVNEEDEEENIPGPEDEEEDEDSDQDSSGASGSEEEVQDVAVVVPGQRRMPARRAAPRFAPLPPGAAGARQLVQAQAQLPPARAIAGLPAGRAFRGRGPGVVAALAARAEGVAPGPAAPGLAHWNAGRERLLALRQGRFIPPPGPNEAPAAAPAAPRPALAGRGVRFEGNPVAEPLRREPADLAQFIRNHDAADRAELFPARAARARLGQEPQHAPAPMAGQHARDLVERLNDLRNPLPAGMRLDRRRQEELHQAMHHGRVQALEIQRQQYMDRLHPEELVPAVAQAYQGPLAGPLISKDEVMAQVVNLLPDVDQEYALDMINTKILIGKDAGGVVDQAANRAIEMLLDIVGGYPKAQKAATGTKRKALDWDYGEGSSTSTKKVVLDDGEAVDVKDNLEEMDYRQETAGLQRRAGKVYLQQSLAQLERTFNDMSLAHIRRVFGQHKCLYVPTHFDLYNQSILPDDEKPYKPMKQLREPKPERAKKQGKNKGKAKRPAKRSYLVEIDDEGNEISAEIMPASDEPTNDGEQAWIDERQWLLTFLRNKGTAASLTMHRLLDPPTTEPDVDCGCCFDKENLEYMVSCEEGHLFCSTCVVGYMESAIGEQKAVVHCMHESGCTARFLESQLKKAVPFKTLNSFHGIVQAKELESAGIEGFSTCPYCNYGYIIENADEKLFHCQHDECGKVSCRACRKMEHLPRTCAEAAEDNKLDKRHNVEEAMTDALVRKCPGCKRGYMKESGCNKITCHNCGVVSCYLCEKNLGKEGYAHFDQQPGGYNLPRRNDKCRLWDDKGEDTVDRDRVRDARELAQQRVRREAEEQGVQLDQAMLDVALPEVRVGAGLPGAQGQGYYGQLPRGFGLDLLYNPIRAPAAVIAGAAAGVAAGVAAVRDAAGVPARQAPFGANLDFEARNPNPGGHEEERRLRNHIQARLRMQQRIGIDVLTLIMKVFPNLPHEHEVEAPLEPHQKEAHEQAQLRLLGIRDLFDRCHFAIWPDRVPAIRAAYAIAHPDQVPEERQPHELNGLERFYFRALAQRAHARRARIPAPPVLDGGLDADRLLTELMSVLFQLVYRRIAADARIPAPGWLRAAAMDWVRPAPAPVAQARGREIGALPAVQGPDAEDGAGIRAYGPQLDGIRAVMPAVYQVGFDGARIRYMADWRRNGRNVPRGYLEVARGILQLLHREMAPAMPIRRAAPARPAPAQAAAPQARHAPIPRPARPAKARKIKPGPVVRPRKAAQRHRAADKNANKKQRLARPRDRQIVEVVVPGRPQIKEQGKGKGKMEAEPVRQRLQVFVEVPNASRIEADNEEVDDTAQVNEAIEINEQSQAGPSRLRSRAA